MNAVLMRVRAEARRRWRAWFALAVVIGLFGGAVLTCAAGARRTASAYDRFLQQQRAYDAATFYVAFDPAFAELRPEQVEALPSIAESVRGTYFEAEGIYDAFASADERWGRTFNAMKVLEGRRPNPAEPHEVAVPFGAAGPLGARVGRDITLRFQAMRPDGHPEPTPIRLRVTGIVVAPGEFPPGGETEAPPLHVTPAFLDRYADTFLSFEVGYFRLHGGPQAAGRLHEDIRSIADGKVFFVMEQRTRTAVGNAALGLMATALWLLALALGVVGLLTAGQSQARQTLIESDDLPSARALGMTSGQIFAIGMARAAAIGAAASAIAVVAAIAASPLTPFGIAGVVEPSPGFAVDAFVSLVGAGAIFLAVMMLALVPAWRAERTVAARDERITRRSRLAATAWRIGLPAPVVAGIRLALERGRGRTAVPVRSSVGGAALGVAALVMSFTFGASLDRLIDTPALYGLTWGMEVEVQMEGRDRDAAPALARRLAAEPFVAAAAAVDVGIPLTVDGHNATGFAVGFEDAALAPPVIEGRSARTADEIVLGVKTLAATGKRIGESVGVQVSGVPTKQAFTIVGAAVMPGADETDPLGTGSIIVLEAVRRFVPDPPPVTSVYIRLAPGVTPAQARAALERIDGIAEIREAQIPEELVNLRRIQDLPALLAALLAFLALGAIGHALVSIVRRRSRDLAILKSIGFVRAQVRGTVAAQSVTLAVVALAIGIPTGVAVGRWLWSSVATGIGVVATPHTPVRAVAAVIPAAILIAVAISAVPARAAARTRAAIALRAAD